LRISRVTVLGVVLIVAFAAFGVFNMTNTPKANADNGPHVKGWGVTADGCAACHRVHRGVNDTLNTVAIETLCLTCHSTGALGSDLDVMGGSNEGTGGALRAGGFVRARINTADPSLPTPGATPAAILTIGTLAAPGELTQSRHDVGATPQTIWGNGPINATPAPGLAGYDLSCTSCHDPHGNGNYRILRPIPDGSGAPTPGYVVPDNPPYPTPGKLYTTNNYFDMTFTGNVATDNILKDTSAWCATCHTRYLATRRDPTPTNGSRVSSGDAIFNYRHTSSGVSYSSAATPVASNVTRACITCHAAHGSNAVAGPDSGPVPDPAGVVGSGSSNSKLLKMNNRGMCQKCHNK
jgi:predicted CXXCH cytochrome family protein